MNGLTNTFTGLGKGYFRYSPVWLGNSSLMAWSHLLSASRPSSIGNVEAVQNERISSFSISSRSKWSTRITAAAMVRFTILSPLVFGLDRSFSSGLDLRSGDLGFEAVLLLFPHIRLRRPLRPPVLPVEVPPVELLEVLSRE